MKSALVAIFAVACCPAISRAVLAHKQGEVLGQPAYMLISPFPRGTGATSKIRGTGAFVPGDDHSRESLLSSAMAACGAKRFEWRNWFDEQPGSIAWVEIEQPQSAFIRCIAKRVRFDFYVRRITREWKTTPRRDLH